MVTVSLRSCIILVYSKTHFFLTKFDECFLARAHVNHPNLTDQRFAKFFAARAIVGLLALQLIGRRQLVRPFPKRFRYSFGGRRLGHVDPIILVGIV
jgi:hypothetical protein